MDADQPSWPPRDLVREQAYLISRGVRPLAFLGSCAWSDAEIARARGLLLTAGCHYPSAIPWIIDVGGGQANYGYAAATWAAELYRWALLECANTERRDQIIGLLLGYDARAIAEYTARDLSRRRGIVV